MARRDIVVIGTSSGGVEALQAVARKLPGDLPAAVFVVLHIALRSRGLLPQILSAVGALPARLAEDGAPIEPSNILCCAPRSSFTPGAESYPSGAGTERDHRRPSINVTFRSAATTFGDRVIGVVMTGQLDDGTAGLWDIKRRGGLAVVQNPEDAAFPSMPFSALREVEADHMVPASGIGPLLARLVGEEIENGWQAQAGDSGMDGRLTDITCPDCRGTIWEVPQGNGVEFRCRVGHSFSPRSMLAEHFATQEKGPMGGPGRRRGAIPPLVQPSRTGAAGTP